MLIAILKVLDSVSTMITLTSKVLASLLTLFEALQRWFPLLM